MAIESISTAQIDNKKESDVKVTEKCANQGEETLFVCDFSPLKSSAAAEHLQNASLLEADYISVAYNPGKAVRGDNDIMDNG